MRFHRTGLLVFAALLAAPGGVTSLPAAAQGPQGQITVAAAISMKDALEALAAEFSARPGAPKAVLTFGASGILEKQIEEGAPVDVFLSAAPAQMNTLEQKSLLLEGTRRNVAGNRLVLVVPAGTTMVRDVEDLKKPQVRTIAIGETRSVPAGQYAAEALRNLKLFDALSPKFVFAQNVRAVLAYVADRDADAGFVYETDAKISDKVAIACALPASSYAPVVYPAAVIRNSQNAAGAKAFLEFLASAEARAILQKYGFTPPAK
ncbi:MAG TPA: molybdate ABC transporter substrate-binding protein [Candidatus Acidoferrales bacterium]|nr:molybdate ABC transporter substrate-binding protein [Candidatus Acidoferrales bacterium]